MLSVILACISVITVVVYIIYTTNIIKNDKQDYKKGKKDFIAASPGQPFTLPTQEETNYVNKFVSFVVALGELCQSIVVIIIFYRGVTNSI